MPLPVGLIAYNKLVDYAAQRSIYVDDPTANALLVGNGSSALQTIAPGTNNQVLVSNGTAWAAGDAPTPSLSSPGDIGGTTPEIVGSVYEGAPPNGDFVPEGIAGMGYVSPGYAEFGRS